MKLSEGVEWGIHCVILLATVPKGVTLTTRALAQAHGVSETYLAKHLQALTNAKIIESLPGPKGGYHISRPPEKITLLALVEAIDGREPAFRCTDIRKRGPRAIDDPSAYQLPCVVHVAMARAEKAWRDVLRSQTIADLIDQHTKSADPRLQERSDAWLKPHTERMKSAKD